MSERKGGAHKTPRKSIKIDVDTHRALGIYAQRKNLNMTLIAEMFIEAGVEVDLYDAKWKENLQRVTERMNRWEMLDNACDGLCVGEDNEGKELWSCVWFRLGRPPQIRILGNRDLTRGRCLACGKTEEVFLGFKERDTKIAELETELKGRADQVFKAPKCHGGGQLYNDEDDQLVFRNCKKHPSGPVSVEKFCRVYQGGLPCMSFAEVVVGVSEKT